MGSRVSLHRGPFGLNGLLPPLRRGHRVTIHHIQVSSDLFLSSAATRADELKRREAVTDRGVGALSFSFLFLFPFLLSPLLPRSHPIPSLAFYFPAVLPKLNSACTLSNPRPVLSQLWNNSRRTSTTANRSLQENSPHPAGLLDRLEPTAETKQPVTSSR